MSAGLRLLERLAVPAARAPDAVAIIESSGKTISRRAFHERVESLTHGFMRAGLQPGDRVLFAVRPCIEAIALIIAITETGGVLVPAAVGIGDVLFESQMRLVAPKWVVAESVLLAASFSRIARRMLTRLGVTLPSMHCIRSASFIRVGPPVPWGPSSMSANALAARGKTPAATLPTISDDAEAIVVFTSGTTAAPKGVVHSQRSLRATLDIIDAQLDVGEGDTVLSRDLHMILPALFHGARVVISTASKFSPSRIAELFDTFQVTHTFAVTADCQSLLEHLTTVGRRLPDSVRQVLIGAAPVHATFMDRFRDILPSGATAWCVYGMSEMLPVSSIELSEKLSFEGAGDVVGRPVAGVHVRVTADGELAVRGRNLFTGYLGGPAVEEHLTGDLARLDDGRIVLVGRAKDMIIRREHNIYPALHEPVIERIGGVRRCAMVGVFDDAAADERVVLAIEPESHCDDDAFIERLRRDLRAGPNRIDDAAQPDLILRTRIPLSGRSSKVDREAVRQLAQRQLACASR
ncbi:MAG: class I adenylate-forming enzyme family protein [bacterium]